MNKVQGKKLIPILTLAWLLFQAPHAFAADDNGQFIISGRGTHTCAAEMRTYGVSIEAHAWMLGYLSAYNHFAFQTYDITGNAPAHAATNWQDAYCRMNPGQTIYDAVTALIATFSSTRQTMAPEVVIPLVPTPTLKTPPLRKWDIRVKPKDNRY